MAQQRASEGNHVEAIHYARLSLSKVEDGIKKPMRWNDYVLATIAFIEKDKEKFQLHYQSVRESKDLHAGNAMNLQLLDRLWINFDKNYHQATTQD